jgi:hypothetical protein
VVGGLDCGGGIVGELEDGGGDMLLGDLAGGIDCGGVYCCGGVAGGLKDGGGVATGLDCGGGG